MTGLVTAQNRHGKENGNKSSAVAEMGDRAIAKWPEKWGAGLRPTSVPSGILIHPAVWPRQTWVEDCGAMLLLRGRAGSPSNNVAWPRPTSIPSGILIHPAVWPQ